MNSSILTIILMLSLYRVTILLLWIFIKKKISKGKNPSRSPLYKRYNTHENNIELSLTILYTLKTAYINRTIS